MLVASSKGYLVHCGVLFLAKMKYQALSKLIILAHAD